MRFNDTIEADDVLAREVRYQDPCGVFSAISGRVQAVFLDSPLPGDPRSRYAFIAADPFKIMTSKADRVTVDGESIIANPFEILREELARFPLKSTSELPPFQGGAVGYFGYELAQHLERIPLAPMDDMQFPDMAVGFFDVVMAFDTQEGRAWVLSCGYPEREPARRRARARSRADAFEALLASGEIPAGPPSMHPGITEVRSNFTRVDYQAAVQRVIDYIFAGDIFQANLSQRFQAELAANDTPFALYRRLRADNPAPFAAYLDLGGVVVASSSPERFLKLQDGQVETRPIKGTRPRSPDPGLDRALAEELCASEKDRAENVMIVDLLRNDISRVCLDDSVQVPRLCALESFATVHHLVSTIEGRLRPDATAVDLLEACFPGGSITGAPKIRAMEIIAELEPTLRGPYCGNIGYLGFDGAMDSNIAIRTFAIKGSQVTFQAGGGIVADSDPAAEYQETLDKAQALLKALSPGARIYDPRGRQL